MTKSEPVEKLGILFVSPIDLRQLVYSLLDASCRFQLRLSLSDYYETLATPIAIPRSDSRINMNTNEQIQVH